MKIGSHISDFIYLYPSISAKTKKQSSVVSLSKQSAAFMTTGGRDQSAQVETHESRPQEAELTRPSPPISGALRDKETQVPMLFSNVRCLLVWSSEDPEVSSRDRQRLLRCTIKAHFLTPMGIQPYLVLLQVRHRT